MCQEPFLTKLTLRNYRSIRNEAVTFANPLFLVGRNGSGKSNFVDAVAFLAECMGTPLEAALDRRGGFGRVSHIHHNPSSFVTLPMGMRADFCIEGEAEQTGHYLFLVENTAQDGHQVAREQCTVYKHDEVYGWFDRRGDQFTSNLNFMPALDSQALSLPILGGLTEFASVVKGFAGMRIYEIEPDRIRRVQKPSGSRFLERDGSNLAGILKQMKERDPQILQRVTELLNPVVPDIASIDSVTLRDGSLSLLFSQKTPDLFDETSINSVLLGATAMSDGTLRALGLIVAGMQVPLPLLLGIEEPEASLHPGALGAIADLIEVAAQTTQVIVTTHSPELLDTKWISPENLRVVEWEKGATYISELGAASVSVLQDHLAGAGELLRANALEAAPRSERSLNGALFDKVAA